VLAPAEGAAKRHAQVFRLDDDADAAGRQVLLQPAGLEPADDRCCVVLDVGRPGARSD